MTFYKYAERKVANQMDWSVVGKEMTAEMNEVQRIRDEKQAKIEQASKTTLDTIANAPMGEHIGANNVMLDYSSDLTEYQLQLNRDLKAGKIKSKEYLQKTSNLKSGTDNIFAIGKEYNAEFKAKMDAYNSGSKDVSAQTIWEMSQIEGFANLTDTKLYINPFDGNPVVGKKVLNPETGQYEVSKNPQDLMTPQALRNRLKSTVPQLDVDTKTQTFAKALEKDIRVVMQGGTLTLNDVMQKPEFEKAETDYINSMLVNPTDAGSVLLDYAKVNSEGIPYTPTADPKEAERDSSKVLMILDPQNPRSGRMIPKLSPEQEKAAKEILRNQIRVKLPREETPMPIFKPSTPQYIKPTEGDLKRQEADKLALEFLSKGAVLYHGKGGKANIEDAIQFFRSLPEVANGRGTITKINRNPDGLEIEFSSAKGEFFPLSFVGTDGKPITQEQFLEKAAALVLGRKDISHLLPMIRDYDPNAPRDTQTVAAGQDIKMIAPFNEAKVLSPTGSVYNASDRAMSQFNKNKGGVITATFRRDKENFTSYGDAIIDYFKNDFPDKQKISGMKYDYDIAKNTISVTVGGRKFTQEVVKDKKSNQKRFVDMTGKIWDYLAQGGSATPKTTTQKPLNNNASTSDIDYSKM